MDRIFLRYLSSISAPGVRALLLVLLLTACLLAPVDAQDTSIDDSGPASLGSRDFPADIPFEDWKFEGRVATYVQELIVQSGGAGLGLGLIFSIAMLFHMFCWGMCCNCCRCCCFKQDEIRECACSEKQNRKYLLILACLITLSSIGGVVSIFFNTSTTFESIETSLTDVQLSVQDAENFICAGFVPTQLRAGSELSDLRTSAGGNVQLMARCDNGSVGAFMWQIDVRINNTFDFGLSIIDGTDQVLVLLNTTRDDLRNATDEYQRNLNLYNNLTTATLTAEDQTNTLRSKGKYQDQVPNVDYDQISTEELSEATSALTVANRAIVEYDQIRSDVSRTIKVDLQQNVGDELRRQRVNIITEISRIEVQLIDTVEDLVDAETTLEDNKEEVSQRESWAEPIVALIFAIGMICVIIMLVGYLIKRKWVITMGGYIIFSIFIWLCLALGLVLVFSMITYDSCGCEGDFTADGCKTTKTLFETNTDYSINIGETRVNLSSTITSLLLCPSRTNSTTNYVYSPDSNFIDILGVRQVFNMTSRVQSPINRLRSASDELVKTSEIDLAIQLLDQARGLSYVEVSDLRNFNENGSIVLGNLTTLNVTLTELRDNESDPRWENLYYTTVPISSEARTNNTEALTSLQSSYFAVLASETLLDSTIPAQQRQTNMSTERAIGNLREIDELLLSTRNDSRRIIDELESLVRFILEINRFTPCAFVGSFYSSVIITTYCETTYKAFDSISPGAITCLASMLLAFFLLTGMRDCVDFHNEELEEENDPELRIKDVKDGKDELGHSPAAREAPMVIAGASTQLNEVELVPKPPPVAEMEQEPYPDDDFEKDPPPPGAPPPDYGHEEMGPQAVYGSRDAVQDIVEAEPEYRDDDPM
eukprot:CAMPEP_0114518386 /NCGR_PEP_ID=MMETSP0109-20121206/18417_1 /TAXON_ID=29199 /ORGANISM="Chlorarachnion reptans, Strain CCCM449" /LENGTH=879 /DNA_ID=CAMNT_0001699005 /DNA_START=5 /DNA_END=2644 /DNA_ORIENTATION=+